MSDEDDDFEPTEEQKDRRDIERLFEDIDAAEEHRDEHLKGWESMIARFHGPGFRPSGTAEDDYDPEAYAYELVSMYLPKLAYSPPGVSVRALAVGERPQRAAIKLEAAIELWTELTWAETSFRRIALDFCFTWGVAKLVPRAVPWHRDCAPDFLPRLVRVDQGDFVMDHQAKHHTEALWMGDRWTVSKERLLEWAKKRPKSEKWDIASIEALACGVGPVESPTNRSKRGEPPDDLVEVFQIWRADDKAGTIECVARHHQNERERKQGAKPERIRERQAYKGPQFGPYLVAGAIDVPNSPFPMGPIAAIDQQIRDHNKDVRLARRAIDEYRRGFLIDESDRKFIENLKNTRELITAVKQLNKDKVVPYEIGGLTPQMVEHIAMSRERLDRVSGMDEVMRGSVSGKATATEVAIAEGSSSMRVAGVTQAFHTFARRCMWGIGHLLWHSKAVKLPLPPGVKTGEINPIFEGGAKELGAFEAMGITVDPYSMERTSDALQQQRAIVTLDLLTKIAMFMPHTPWMRWKDDILPKLGHQTRIDLSTAVDADELDAGKEAAQQGLIPPPPGFGGGGSAGAGAATHAGMNGAAVRAR